MELPDPTVTSSDWIDNACIYFSATELDIKFPWCQVAEAIIFYPIQTNHG